MPLVAIPAAAGVGRRIRDGALSGPGQVLGHATRPVPEVVHHEDGVQLAAFQLGHQLQQTGHAGGVVNACGRLQRRHDAQGLAVRPLGGAHDAQHVDAVALQGIEIALQLVPARRVSFARQGQGRPVVETTDDERLAVPIEAGASHLQVSRQLRSHRRR